MGRPGPGKSRGGEAREVEDCFTKPAPGGRKRAESLPSVNPETVRWGGIRPVSGAGAVRFGGVRVRRGVLILGSVLLSGCASPSPEYFGVTPQRVTVEGTEIAVYRRGDRAQAIRLGGARRGEHGAMRLRMVAATEQATGCAVARSEGDSGVLNMRLSC